MTEPEIMSLCVIGFVLVGAGISALIEELSKKRFLVEVYEYVNGTEITHLSMTLHEKTCPDIEFRKYDSLHATVLQVNGKSYHLPCQTTELTKVRVIELNKSKVSQK